MGYPRERKEGRDGVSSRVVASKRNVEELNATTREPTPYSHIRSDPIFAAYSLKLLDRRTQLMKLRRDPNLSNGDRRIIHDILKDTQDALSNQHGRSESHFGRILRQQSFRVSDSGCGWVL